MIWIGVDNGADGGIVAIDEGMRVVAQYEPPYIDVGVRRKSRKTGEMRDGVKRVFDIAGARDIVNDLVKLSEHGGMFAVLEHAQPMPKEGSVTSFHYGGGVYAYRMAFAMAGVSYDVVRPQDWQRQVLAGVEGTDTKARAIVKSCRTLAGLDMVGRKSRREGRADAACMAIHAMMTRPPPREHVKGAGKRPPAPPRRV
jgi:hypothetical protein